MTGVVTRIGVVGVGSLGFHHARLLATMEGAQLVGVHDARPERQAEVAAKLGVPPAASLDGLLETVSAVVIAVPTQSHEAVAVRALERGVHVLIEKPIAPTMGAADRILAVARSTGALVQIGHVERFNAAIRACEPFLEEPMFVESHRLAPFAPRGTDVAVVLDLMIHDLDLVLSLMKRPVESISAVGVPVLTSSPDIANARLEFEGGGVANLTASRVSLERMRKIRFFQRSGYISLDLAAGKGEFLRLKPGVSLDAIGELAAGGGAAAAGASPADESGGITLLAAGAAGLLDLVERVSFTGDGAEPLARELTSFLAAVQGISAVPVTGEDGRRALAVALEIVDRIGRHVAH